MNSRRPNTQLPGHQTEQASLPVGVSGDRGCRVAAGPQLPSHTMRLYVTGASLIDWNRLETAV